MSNVWSRVETSQMEFGSYMKILDIDVKYILQFIAFTIFYVINV